MNYIEKALSEVNYEVNSALSKEAKKKAAEVEKRIEKINTLIADSNQKIQLWQNEKLTANKVQKAALNELIQAEKEILIANKRLLSDEKSKQDAYEESAKSYVEANKIIMDSYKERNSLLQENMDISDTYYKIWLQNNEDTASKTELFEKELSYLNEQLKIQESVVNDTKIAYGEMTELYGDTCLESKALYSSLLDEVYAYNKIAESIRDVTTANLEAKAAEQKESIFLMNDYLKKYKDSLLEGGFSEEEVYEIARKVSGFSVEKENEVPALPVNLIVNDGEITRVANEISTSIATDINAHPAYTETGKEFAVALGNGFIEEFKNVASDILIAAQATAKEASLVMQSAINNTTTNYNFSSSLQTISQQIEQARHADEMNKARGIL